MNCKLVAVEFGNNVVTHHNIYFADAFNTLQKDWVVAGVIIEYCTTCSAKKEDKACKPKTRVIKYKKSGLYRIR